ncbi:MAG TPA: hypothetical protein VLE96_05475 [Chlamydiales bacterium]|nr:hypothetical protein [Chlamydiales bacterium]
MRISSTLMGIFGGACTGSINPLLAEAAPQSLGFGDTLSIRAVNGPVIVYTIQLSGSVSALLQAKKLVVKYRTKVIAHLPRSDYSTFQFQVHLTLKDKQGEVLDVIDFNCSESKPEGSITVFVDEEIARKVNSVSAKLFAS